MQIDIFLPPAGSNAPPLPRGGAHTLSWSYLLDEVVADAYHSGLARLELHLPDDARAADAELRAELTRAAAPSGAPADRVGVGDVDGVSGVNGVGGALLDVDPGGTPDPSWRRLYLLRAGWPRPHGPATPGPAWRLERELGAFRLEARALGAAAGVATRLRRPRAADAAAFAMRRWFAGGAAGAYYRLGVWRRDGAGPGAGPDPEPESGGRP